MIDKLGKAVLLFGSPNGDHIVGALIVERRPGNCFWELIPIPQNAEKNRESNRDSGAPYRRSRTIGFRGR